MLADATGSVDWYFNGLLGVRIHRLLLPRAAAE
jgi:hypothetical protein